MVYVARFLFLLSSLTIVFAYGYRPAKACTSPSDDAGDVVVVPDGGSGGGGDTGEDPGGGGGGGGGSGSGADSGSGSGDGSGSGADSGSGSGDGSGSGSDGGSGSGDGSGSGSGSGSGDGSGSGTGDGSAAGGGSGSGDGSGSGTPDNSEDPGPLGVSFESGVPLNISWSPGMDVDSDPNNSVWWRHGGHTIDTRVVVFKDGEVVADLLVPQYEYGAGEQGDSFPAITRAQWIAQEPGRYQVAVQSVFYRHSEVKFGLYGRWLDIGQIDDMPEVDPSVAASTSFVVTEQVARDGAMGGCAAAEGSSVALIAFATLVLIPRRRRR